jgi:hypothetical protein
MLPLPLILIAFPLSMRAGASAIWAVNDGEKVDRDDRSHPAKRSNSACDGRTVKLYGARNEIGAFQVVVEADDKGVQSLSARLSALVQS